MGDTEMTDADPSSQEEEQSDTNNQGQTQPAAGISWSQPGEYRSQGNHIPSDTAHYEKNLENRQKHDHEWWGERHTIPEDGDPDREFVYSRNKPISSEEFQTAVEAFNKVATDGGKELYDPLGVHLRPTTPPEERAEKQAQGLQDQGYRVTRELRKEINGHFSRNSGVLAALQEYCRDGDLVPLEHANELLKMIDRLKLEFATWMADEREKYRKLNDSYDDYKKRSEKQIQELKDESRKAGAEFKDAIGRPTAKESELEDKISSLTKDKSALRTKVQLYEDGASREQVEQKLAGGYNVVDDHAADLKAAEERAQEAEREREQGRQFHQAFYTVVYDRVSAWKAKAEAANDPSNNDVSPEQRELLQEVAKGWDDMKSQYQREWPPATGAFEGQIERDIITQDALDSSWKQLKHTHDISRMNLQDIADKETKAQQKLDGMLMEIDRKEMKIEELNRTLERFSQDKETPPSDSPTSDNSQDKVPSSPVSSAPDDITQLKEKMAKLEEELAHCTELNKGLEDSNGELRGDVGKLKQELEDVREESKAKIEELEVQREDLKTQLAMLVAERDGLQVDLEKIQGEKAELEQLQTVQKDEMKKLTDEKKGLEKLQAEITNKVNDLEKEKKELKGKQAAGQDELKKLTDEKNGLEECRMNLEKAQEENKKLTEQNRDLHGEARRLSFKNKELGESARIAKAEVGKLDQQVTYLQNCRINDEKAIHRLAAQAEPNYASADDLIVAAGRDADNSEQEDHHSKMSLMDRINYLNLCVFLRTRNYVELALREGSNRLANMLIHDAKNWAEQCKYDLAKMDPSVNEQIKASMYVLSGLRRVMAAKDLNEVKRGSSELRDGRDRLRNIGTDRVTFGQLLDLSENLVGWMNTFDIQPREEPEMRRGLQSDRLSWLKNADFVAARRRKRFQDKVKDDPNMKAGVLRGAGVHSPLSPEHWNNDVDLNEERFMA